MLAFCKFSCFAALLAITTLTGCAAVTSPAPVAMMGTSCAPGQRQAVSASQVSAPAASADAAVHHDFTPLFAATCRPDHQFTTFNMITHADLALAFIETRPVVMYDFMPMFGATASPAARAVRVDTASRN